MTCPPFSTAIPDYAFPSTAEEPSGIFGSGGGTRFCRFCRLRGLRRWRGQASGGREAAQAFQSHITSVTNTSHVGTLPLEKSFARLESGSVELYGVKRAEDGEGLILRGMELTGDGKDVVVALEGAQAAYLCDTHERVVEPIAVENGRVRFNARPFGLFTIRIKTE